MVWSVEGVRPVAVVEVPVTAAEQSPLGVVDFQCQLPLWPLMVRSTVVAVMLLRDRLAAHAGAAKINAKGIKKVASQTSDETRERKPSARREAGGGVVTIVNNVILRRNLPPPLLASPRLPLPCGA